MNFPTAMYCEKRQPGMSHGPNGTGVVNVWSEDEVKAKEKEGFRHSPDFSKKTRAKKSDNSSQGN